MNKRLALLAAAACAALLPAAAQVTVYEDASNGTLGTGSLAIGGAASQAVAQTFTVETAGFIIGVLIPLSCASSSAYVMLESVTPEGTPSGPVATGTLMPASSLRATGRFTLVVFPGGVQAAPGSRFSLILATESGTGDCQVRRSTAGAAYAGGRGFVFSLANPTWVALSTTGEPDDLPFHVLMAF
jgi:hypothetical protein